MKVREAIQVLEEHGFQQLRHRGSHRHFQGFVDGQRRLVTVPGKPGDDIAPGTLASMRRQSGLSQKKFR